MRRRTSGEFSPIPPAKTKVSTPPSAAANAPRPVLGSVAEQLDRLGGADVLTLPRQKVAKVRARLRDTEQSGFVIDEVMELIDRQPLSPHQEPDQAGVDITAARAHDQP